MEEDLPPLLGHQLVTLIHNSHVHKQYSLVLPLASSWHCWDCCVRQHSASPLGPWAPMGSPSRGGGVSRLSLPTPFSPIFVCPSAYRNLSPVLLFTHQLLPTYLQFSSSDYPFCLHRPFFYIFLLYKPSFCHFSFSLWSTRDPAR